MKTTYYSYKLGKLADGCKYCVKGRKLVLFVTGLCSRTCFYCSLSDNRKDKDVVYANEWKTSNDKNIIKEARLCKAKGAGITGGDPLLKLSRTVKYIKLFKKEFGKGFHIHLYTPLERVNAKSLEKLFKAGLDEIRFHPDLLNKKLWSRIKLARKFKWAIGVEIPVIPKLETQTKELKNFIQDKIDFLNLNELETSDCNVNQLIKMGYKPKTEVSYAIKGSDEMAKRLLRYCKDKVKNVHYCTAKLKDKVQLAKRIKLRAKSISKKYDVVTDEGMLLRGVIYGKGNLIKLKKEVQEEFDIPSSLIEVEDKRILIASWILDELKKELKKKGLKISLVEEYPTADKLLVMEVPI